MISRATAAANGELLLLSRNDFVGHECAEQSEPEVRVQPVATGGELQGAGVLESFPEHISGVLRLLVRARSCGIGTHPAERLGAVVAQTGTVGDQLAKRDLLASDAFRQRVAIRILARQVVQSDFSPERSVSPVVQR